MSDWVRDVAEALQCPPDLPAVFSLAVVSCAIGGTFEVRLNETWTTPTQIFVCVALESGESKTPVYQLATRSIHSFEKSEAIRLQGSLAEVATQRRYLEKRLGALEAKAGKLDDEKAAETLEELTRLRLELENLPSAVSPKLYVDDATPEALVRAMGFQQGRLAILSDEGGPLDHMAGRYSDRVPHIEVYLQAYSGSSIRVERVTREGGCIDDPALTIGVTVQPSVLQELGESRRLRSRGLVARFLMAVPVMRVGTRDPDPDAIPVQTLERFDERVTALLNLTRLNENLQRPPKRVLLGDEHVRPIVVQAKTWIEPLLADGEQYAHLRDWCNKWDRIARLAAILHLAESEDLHRLPQQINAATADRARLIYEYFLAHALGTYDLFGADPEQAGARHVLAWLKRRELREFSARDVFNGNRGQFRRMEHLQGPLRILEEYGWIRQAPPTSAPGPNGGRPRSPRYEVPPAQYPQNMQNPSSAPSASSAEGSGGEKNS